MQYFKFRPSADYGHVDLRGCIGDGERWVGAWVGVVYVEVAFDDRLFVEVDWPITPPLRLFDRIIVADNISVSLKDCPECPGGWREPGQDKATLIWRCALQLNQIQSHPR